MNNLDCNNIRSKQLEKDIYNNIQNVNPGYDSYIIKPPNLNKTHSTISNKLVIDSRDRDYVLYPNPSDYTFKIDFEYNDVTAVELILAQIPNTGYNIYDGNNQILLHDHLNNPILVKLKNGEYTNESFIKYLNGSKGNLFNDFNGNGQYFNFYLDSDTNKLRIQSNKSFRFNDMPYKINNQITNCNNMNIDDYYKMIKFNSIDKTLGFLRQSHYASKIECDNSCNPTCECDPSANIDISGSTPLSDKSSNNYDLYEIDLSGNDCDLLNLYSPGDYIDIDGNIYRIYEIMNSISMKIEDINSSGGTGLSDVHDSYELISNNIFDIECPDYVILDIPEFHLIKSDNTIINNSFAIIPLNKSCKTIIDSDTNMREIKNFNPPLARLSSLRIRFLRNNGSEYNFNGREHMLMFNIYSLNQPGRYNNFN